MLISKNQLVERIKNSLKEKVFALKQDISSLVIDSSENSKPTSGDKHEVGLEMAMGELDRLSAQLDTYKRQLSELELMDFSEKVRVESGALVKTNRGLFFVSVAFRLLKVDGLSIFCLSAQSPLAQAMMGKRNGDAVELNGITHKVIKVK